MALPYFYQADITLTTEQVTLDESTSKHVAQVLRMQVGEQLQLTDGRGNLFTTAIIDDNRKKCLLKILSISSQPAPNKKITIAISLVKNVTRFEWFLEKATEIGVNEIVPLICTRTEKQHFRQDRMQGILVSAMLQSQQSWLPVLQEPTKLLSILLQPPTTQKLIAHCEATSKQQLIGLLKNDAMDQIILIGPEGDFSPEEITQALQHHFIPVALGNTRLRTETAGVVAATLLCNG